MPAMKKTDASLRNPLTGKQVLLCESHPVTRLALQNMLEWCGMEVFISEDRQSAIKLLNNECAVKHPGFLVFSFPREQLNSTEYSETINELLGLFNAALLILSVTD